MWIRNTVVYCLLTFALSSQSLATPKDNAVIDKAVFNEAHTQNHFNTNSTEPLAMYQQALSYLLGRNGVQKSAEKAADIFKTLAEQNWSSAQHMLGNMYYKGKGVEKNDLLAYKWLSLASKNNLQLAEAIHSKRRALHNKLQSSLSSQSLHQVEMWIAEWKPNLQLAQRN